MQRCRQSCWFRTLLDVMTAHELCEGDEKEQASQDHMFDGVHCGRYSARFGFDVC